MKHAKELLMRAHILVGGDREKDYGDKVENHTNIAKLWSSYLDAEIKAHDVAIMMVLLKIARTKVGIVNEDTYTDMAAYGAIAGEIKFKEPKKESKGERRGSETAKYLKSLGYMGGKKDKEIINKGK